MTLVRGASPWVVVLCALAGASASAITRDDYARAEGFLPYATAPLVLHTVEQPTWLPDDTLWYKTRTARGLELLHVDPAQGLLESRPCAAPPCSPVPAPNPTESLAPDRTHVAFVREFNVWVRDLTSGRETQMTTDGVQDFGYATDNPGWEHTNRPIVTWSPDSKRLATFQQDQRGVGEMYLVSTRLGHPELETWKYPMAGDAVVTTIQRVIIDLATRTVVRLQMPADAHRSSPCYDVQCGDGTLADVQWSADGSHLAFVSTSRDHKRAQLRLADATSGTVREILEETSPSYYESDISSTSHGAVNWRYLPESNEIIWFSERDDHAHLYLYDVRTGQLTQRITQGHWNVVEILALDEKARTLSFTAVGVDPQRDPYYVHFYRIGLDGKHLRLLTPENANHEITVAASGRYFVDSYSTPDVPPIAVLRDRNGALVRMLERADIAPLLAAGWKAPTPIEVKARDGTTDLYGLLFTPTRFDASKKYPLVDWVYPGPQIGSVGSRSFAASRGDRQALAELGFVVIAIDGMGTPFRSKRFHDTAYDNLRDNTLPDQITGIRQLGLRFPWIDLDRVGIYGHSGGGYAAATAMLTYPKFFKVGIAESGNHDLRAYTDDWGEKFGRVEGQDVESLASHLEGHLLLAHGTLDDNVPPYLTLLLADSLIKANKDFDLVMLPNQRHPYRAEAGTYMTRRRWDYFVRYLQNAEPPHEFTLHAPAGADED